MFYPVKADSRITESGDSVRAAVYEHSIVQEETAAPPDIPSAELTNPHARIAVTCLVSQPIVRAGTEKSQSHCTSPSPVRREFHNGP